MMHSIYVILLLLECPLKIKESVETCVLILRAGVAKPGQRRRSLWFSLLSNVLGRVRKSAMLRMSQAGNIENLLL